MKLGGLFSGVGGFELAWTQLGHEVAWMCEWDAKARKVLEARFPSVPIYPDVRDLDPAEVEAVDVLTGGSPCQGFSIAGQRTGLEHSESQLFADYVRIMDGLAERGLKYAIWENVPGVLSIRNDDGERTFTHVIGALAGGSAAVRPDPKRKWNVGLVANGGRAVSWRVLDSRYFGVAQRRRRVFACVAFGDSCEDRAGRTLLAVSEGVRGDSASGVQAGEGTAAGVEGRAGVPSVAMTIRKVRSSEWMEDETGSTLAARDYKDSGDLVVESQAFNVGDTRTTHAIVEPQAIPMLNMQGSKSNSVAQEDGPSYTLNAMHGHDVHAIVEPVSYGVRRLTPVECERLQSFPDGWTEPAGSDSARYKAMGNAVTVNVVRWILNRMVQAG